MYYRIVYELAAALIVGILHTALLKKVLDTFLAAEDKNGLKWKAIFAVYYLMTTAAYSAFHVSLIYGLCNLAGIIGMACFYRAPWEKKIWIAMVFFCLDTGSGTAAAFACSEDMGMQRGAVSALILLVCVAVLCHIPDLRTSMLHMENREIALDKKQMFLLSAIPILSLAAYTELAYGSVDRVTAVFLCAVVMAFNLCVFYLYHILLKNYAQLREQDIYKQQTAAYQNQLEAIRESQSRIRALKHDMKNHMLALEGLAKSGGTEKLIEYIGSMRDFMQNPSEYVYTGNDALDSLLNFKLQRAQKELKKVETDIVLPEKMKLHSFDFNVIVGNILDNAAAAAVQTDEQFIKISIRMENGVLLLNMVNSCAGIPKGVCDIRRLSDFGKPLSGHGIGLANVRRIVEKYHGDMEMRCEGNRMATDIMLYMENL